MTNRTLVKKNQRLWLLSRTLVLIQFVCIVVLFWQAGFRWVWRVELVVLFGLGCYTGLHAILTMRCYSWSVFPEPDTHAQLCRNGLYRWIRHPMYLAVVLTCLAVTWSARSYASWIWMALLLAVIHMKIYIEERMWLEREPEKYRAYIKTTKRLIPYVY